MNRRKRGQKLDFVLKRLLKRSTIPKHRQCGLSGHGCFPPLARLRMAPRRGQVWSRLVLLGRDHHEMTSGGLASQYVSLGESIGLRVHSWPPRTRAWFELHRASMPRTARDILFRESREMSHRVCADTESGVWSQLSHNYAQNSPFLTTVGTGNRLKTLMFVSPGCNRQVAGSSPALGSTSTRVPPGDMGNTTYLRRLVKLREFFVVLVYVS